MAMSKFDNRVKTEIHDLLHPNKEIAKSFPIHWPEVKCFTDLFLGDHVCYFEIPYYRHGIIIAKHRSNHEVTQLRYHLSRGEIDIEKFEYTNGNFYVVDGRSKRKINLTKAVYSGPCFNMDKIVQRALARCNEKQYDPITNFARAYPRWCRTGKGGLTAINEIQLNESRMVIHHIQDLTKGDHIMFDRGSYSHHAIVLAVSPVENKIEVIHFTTGQSQGKGSIERQVITRHDQPGTLYRLTYREVTESEPDLVVQRAIMLSQRGLDYDLFHGNCEHLATWCKTGIWGSAQVKSFAVYFLRQMFNFGIKIGAQVLVRLIGEGFATLVDKATSVLVTIGGKQVDIISCVIFCIIDISYQCYDIRKKYKKGELRGDALQEEILKRAVRCLVVDSSVVLGNIIGQIVIPAPVLGAFIGGLCGLALGELLNFVIQKIVAVIKSKKAKFMWERSMQHLRQYPEKLREMLNEFPCFSHPDASCIGLA